MSDNTIWSNIGGKKQFCSFKFPNQTIVFCKNTQNVTGLCEEKSCPLANSKYATIREKNGKLYLYVKEPERMQTVNRQYEEIELSNDYDTAIQQIDEELRFFSDFLKHKCKQRLTSLTEYLERKMKREKNKNIEFSVIKRRFMKKERIAALKTSKELNIEQEVEKELIERMKIGVYGEGLKEKLSSKIEVSKKPHEKKLKKKMFVPYFEESDDDIIPAENLRKTKRTVQKW
ncbi:hypothetical protein EDEG_03573 [Edhazardia aedis USNM 41457]|uniref:Protein MAK16 n=1 Tax=Edhazardia aedis (strain USNM 41457) TaxID=1003232 RepID=J9DH83_EDHAE|nr:hypothetical protein EDEG_03573 [Edhazardia aedis USNM 41457]|eukprot:EJW01965.1 hypothetical protein EDEG_03573 [Edhazardia aedis USNM 41457]